MHMFGRNLQTNSSSRKRRGSSRHYLLFVLSLSIIAAAGFGLYSLLSHLPWLDFQTVQVSGNTSIADSLLQNLAKPWLGDNLLTVPRDKLRGRIAKLARVKSVKLKLSPLHALKIQIEERKAALYLKSTEGDLFPVDSDGLVLEKYSNVYAEDLPVFGSFISNKNIKTGKKLNTASLQRVLKVHRRIQAEAPDFLPLISEYYTVDNTVYIVDARYGTRVIPSSDNLASQFKRYLFVQDNGNIDRNSVVDLRYNNQIVVKAGS